MSFVLRFIAKVRYAWSNIQMMLGYLKPQPKPPSERK